MSLADSLKTINAATSVKQEFKPSKITNEDRKHRIKAFIITLFNNGEATQATRRLLESITESGSWIDPFIMDATTPRWIRKHLTRIYDEKTAKDIQYTWPIEGENYCKQTGLFRRAYNASDYRKIMACTVSHLRLWKLCVEIDEPIMILEQDAVIMRTFRYDMLSDHGFKGICGLNEPFYATRRPSMFHTNAQIYLDEKGIDGRKFVGVIPCPSVDSVGDPPLPQGLAGNSAYVIMPWAAKLLIDKTAELGIWPNDAIMCKQLFPFLQVSFPYYTRVQRLSSTTTK